MNWAALLAATLSLVGVAIGAALQHLFSRAADVQRHQAQLRSEAYVDYLRAVAQAAYSQGAEELHSAKRLAADAKSRIVVYGSPAVLEAMSKLEAVGPILDNDQSMQAFVELAAQMRTSPKAVERDWIKLILGGRRRK